MTHPHPPLGDSHNFGRRVALRGTRVAKPRALLWEWLVLSADSPLRRLLDDAALRDRLGPEAFSFLPALEVFPEPGEVGGEITRIELAPLPVPTDESRRALATIVGRSLALWSWLGVTDLHWENLVLGIDARGHVVFTPLDVEMILSDFSLPTETKLLPDADPEYAAICRHAAGVRRVLPYLGKPVGAADVVAMAAAYRSTLTFLDRHARAIADVFAGLSALKETPIRVCLRGTGDYVRARSTRVWPPLLGAETEQLARGDIPYFFRLYGTPGIHYYGDATLSELKRLPLQGDVPKLDPILPVSRGLRSATRKKLGEDGLFALLGAFDHPALAGTHAVDGLEVSFRKKTLVAKLRTGEELESRRDLRAFVGSVYLPCRCGEVLTAFVPPVTVCEAARR